MTWSEHEGHDIETAFIGAPGTGRVVTCKTCNVVLADTSRILEPWEVE